MAPFGFIQDKLEIKFLILYVAARLDGPVSFEDLQTLVMRDGGIGFFDFSECLSSLTASGHLAQERDGRYAITEKGRRNGGIGESSLPYSVRQETERAVEAFNRQRRRERQVSAAVSRRGDGAWRVGLTLRDDAAQPVLYLELMAPTEDMARQAAERFREHAERVYGDILHALFPS